MNRTVTILVVDDNPLALLSLSELLRGEGYEVMEATTGTEGERLALERGPDLVLLDVILPDMRGTDLCARLKSRPEGRAPFVMLISGSEITSESQARGLAGGADAYLIRPIQNRELLARVHALVRLHQAERALREANAALEERVEERTAALRQEVDERRRAEEVLRQYSERLGILHALDHALLRAASAEETAEAVINHICKFITCHQVQVLELIPQKNEARLLAGHGAGPIGLQLTLSLAQLQRLHRLEEGQPLLERHVPNPFGHGPAPAPTGADTAVLDIPLRAAGRLIGLINLFGDIPDPLPSVHREILDEMADHLAIALEQTRLFEEVVRGRETLQALSLRLVEVQEAERRSLARELHDEIGQVLTGLKMVLSQAPLQAGNGVAEAMPLVDELLERVRQLSLNLRPQILDDLGLKPALEWHFKRFFQQTQVRVRFQSNPLPRRLPPMVETALFRVVQEALTNVARHANTREVSVRLWVEGALCRVQVEDQGSGFDVEKAWQSATSSGLTGMRERASLLGGEFFLESTPGQGTRLTMELPLKESSHAE